MRRKAKTPESIEDEIRKQERFIFFITLNKSLTEEEALFFEIMVQIHHALRKEAERVPIITQWCSNPKFQKKLKRLSRFIDLGIQEYTPVKV